MCMGTLLPHPDAAPPMRRAGEALFWVGVRLGGRKRAHFLKDKERP